MSEQWDNLATAAIGLPGRGPVGVALSEEEVAGTAQPLKVQEPANDRESISPSEWELMRILWTRGQLPTREITRLLQVKRGWAESTVKTFLARLVRKGWLTVVRDGSTSTRGFEYAPAVSELAAMQDSARQLFSGLCAMKRGRALAGLVEDTRLSRSDIELLQGLLADKLAAAPESIACDCLPEDCSC